MDSFLRKIVVGGGITLAALAIAKAMVFLNYIIAARLLTADQFGEYSIVIYLQNLVLLVACLGVPLTITKKVSHWLARDAAKAQVVASGLLVMLLLFSSITSILYVLLSGTIADSLYHDPQLASVLRISSLFVFVASISAAMSALAQGCQKVKAIAITSAVAAICWQPISLLAITTYELDGAIIAMVAYYAISAVLLYSTVRQCVMPSWSKVRALFSDRAELRGLLWFILPAFLTGIVIAPAYWLGRTVLVLDWDFGEVGQFQIADSLSQVLLIVPVAIGIQLLPAVSEQHALDSANVGRTTVSLLRLAVYSLAILCIVALPLTQIAITTLYGSQYEGALSSSILMFASATFIASGSVVSSVILGIGRMWDALKLNLLWLAAYLCAVFLLVPSYGSEGLAASYAVSYAFYLLLMLWYFWKEFKISVSRMAGYALSLATFVIVFDIYLLEMGWMVRMFTSVLVAVVFVAAGYFFVLEEKERGYVRSVLRLRT